MIAQILAPATTANLGPGFDVLGAAFDMDAVFEVSDGDGGFLWPDDMGALPGRNLFMEAFAAAFARRGAEVPAVSVRVKRALPLRSGLGSSASAIVAGLRATELFLEPHLSPAETLAIATALEGHPDNVAACLYGGVTIASGLEAPIVRRLPAPPLRAIALYPGGGTSTPGSRAALSARVPRADAVHNVGRAALLVYALMSGEYGLLREATRDQLHEEQRLEKCDWCPGARAAAFRAGAVAMPVSGSGPTLVALVRPQDADGVLRALEPYAAELDGARLWNLAFSDLGTRLQPL